MLNTDEFAQLESAVDDYDKGLHEKAYETFAYLAEKCNDDESQYYLGLMYANGQFVEKDISLAEYWWKKSAGQRNQDANFQLESMSMSTKNSRY
ncbi:MAG: hypothetical protein OEW60_04605 [Thiovulaceae bacterium]|nr:hypothetical protein [Sulfurimonadaceae bacterium]